MSWALASTWPVGGRLSTTRRPVASVTTNVRLEAPPAIGSKSSGAIVPTSAASQAVTGSGSIPFGARATARVSPERTLLTGRTGGRVIRCAGQSLSFTNNSVGIL